MSKPGKICGVILAGGLARRMGGGDKPLAALGNGTLIDHVIDRLSPQVDTFVINANGDPTRFGAFGVPVLKDPVEGFAGPLAGVLAGMDWARLAGFDSIVTVAGDTPYFPRDLVACLWHEFARKNLDVVLAASCDGGCEIRRQPTFGLWRVGLREDLRAALANDVRKVVAFTDSTRSGQVVFDERPTVSFFNVNTPQDLRHAAAMEKAAQT